VEPFDYLRAVRRNWKIVLVAVLVGLLVGFLTRSIEPAGSARPTYQATAVLISTNSSVVRAQGDASDPATVAALATLPPIPQNVADQLGYDGDPEVLAASVLAAVDQDSGLLNISATGGDADRAAELADAFADQLLAQLVLIQQEDTEQQVTDLRAQIRGLEKQIAKLDDSQSDTARNLSGQLEQLKTQLNKLKTQDPDPGFAIYARAVPHRVESAGFSAPRSVLVRLVIAGLLGLLAGIVIAIAVGRLDTKIRTKRSAEERFAAPVLAEVPVIGRRGRRGVVAAGKPSRAAEEFRLLGSELSLWFAAQDGNGSSAKRHATTVLVTSPGPSEGKTTVVANLAATLAEMGRKVLVLSCDFHRPAVHALFSLPNDRGLADVLTSDTEGPLLDGIVKPTAFPNVEVVVSGKAPSSASELLSSDRMRTALDEARGLADVILLDTPPVLVASDATYLLPEVDAVLIVARAAHTEADLAERASELLHRMGAPVRGVVLNQATETPRPRGAGKYYTRRPPSAAGEATTGQKTDAGVGTDSANGDRAPAEDVEVGGERQEIPQR
jgi:capsular exopolysaccharide synthesis family protein